MNLLDGVKGILTNTVVDKAADVLGIENGMMKSALKMFLPALIGGVISKGSTESGAGGLIDLFKKGGFGDDNNGDLMGVLGDSDKRGGMLDTGIDLLGNIFGGKQSGMLDMLLKATGIGKSGGSSLMSFLAPIVINKLAGMVFGNKMSASGLSSYLNEQKDDIMGMVPGMGNLLGGGVTASLGAAAHSSAKSSSQDDSDSGGGMGFLKWLLPLLMLGGLAFWWMNKDKATSETEPAKTTATSSTTKAKPVAENTNASSTTTSTAASNSTAGGTYTVSANGDILNESGSVAYASGSYSLDASNNLVSKDGKIIMAAASIPSDLLSKLKAAIGKLTGTSITVDQMKSMFGDMIVKKAGSKATYGLTNIEFNKENHKISNFSKAEVMGLAEALKANAKGKIEVHVHSEDGDDLSDKRANVIRDMLVTLGVDKGQIKAIGKGKSDAAKAKAGKVDIVVK